MKKWIPRILIAVVAVIILAMIGVFVFLNDIVKKAVETAGPPLTKTEVRLASSKISPLSGSGDLKGLFIGNPEGFKTEFAIKMGEMKVDVDVGSLMSDTIVVEEILIDGPEITFEGGLKGSNLGKILDNLEAATGGGGTDKSKPAEPTKPAAGPGKKFRARDITIRGGKIHVHVQGMEASAKTVPLPDLHLENIGNDGNGVPLAKLSQEILRPMIKAAIKAGGESVGNLGKDAAADPAKAAEGIKSLLKKK